MNDLSFVFEFVLVQISVAFSPGLIIALVINESVQKSRTNGLQVAIGAASGAVFITLISAGVLTFVINIIPQILNLIYICLLYTSPSPRDKRQSRMPSSA